MLELIKRTYCQSPLLASADYFVYKPKPREEVTIIGPVDSYTGYGQLVGQVALGLVGMGFEVRLFATQIDHRHPINPELLKLLSTELSPASTWRLVMHSPESLPAVLHEGVKNVLFTMWETTRLRPLSIEHINRLASHVITPNAWNASCFEAAGVNVPIRVVPLGVDPNFYQPAEEAPACVFGAAGRFAHGGSRKGLAEVVDVFLETFPTERDVQLQLKCFDDCLFESKQDPRVKVLRVYLTDQQMADWYLGLRAFVSMSRAEGWGLHQQQAMARSRPVVAARFGGLAEFMSEENGYCVDYSLQQATGYYEGVGCWAEPDPLSVSRAMRAIYEDPASARAKGVLAASRAGQFTYQNTSLRLAQALFEMGLLNDFSWPAGR